eukprot:gnl/MRDRNA2_/MRDRNA2_77126_c0_seq2.p1 gnl/MRDRNA2_/MRDRNA2_77126_c0~~gnl/MRDRNA2_/MRDRNA2_77126_c0_seq2.p1  ORF type:complete len:344 (+),score=72.71 gnl/MRDRNA2_/MRDRNA2_77126_c0_seq2:28-1032(+)
MPPKKNLARTKHLRRRTAAQVKKLFPEVKKDVPSLYNAKEFNCGACLLAIDRKDEVSFIDACSHAFHDECIFRWSKKENTCPQCKQRFAWRASYKRNGKRTTLAKVRTIDQEEEELEEFEELQFCEICMEVGDESVLILCDGIRGTCNTAFHTTCLGLKKVPPAPWFCPDCTQRGFDVDTHGRRGKRRSLSSSSSKAVSPMKRGSLYPSKTPKQTPSLPSSGSQSSSQSSALTSSARSQHMRQSQRRFLRMAPMRSKSKGASVPVAKAHAMKAKACSSQGSSAQGGAKRESLFSRFVRKRQKKVGRTEKSNSGNKFIKLKPTYETDFFAKKRNA